MLSLFPEPLEVEEWGIEGEGMLEGADTLGEGNLLEFSDPLQVDEGSTDVAWEPYNYTQVWHSMWMDILCHRKL